jgi:hypothetical protein
VAVVGEGNERRGEEDFGAEKERKKERESERGEGDQARAEGI